jgi:hypothetical protein
MFEFCSITVALLHHPRQKKNEKYVPLFVRATERPSLVSVDDGNRNDANCKIGSIT